MPQNRTELIQSYLQDAIATEETFEERLNHFSALGDDQEVQYEFSVLADRCRLHATRLKARLSFLGGSASPLKTSLGAVLEFAPHIAGSGRAIEEQLAENLIVAYSIAAAKWAMYEALAITASAADDTITSDLAREIGAAEREAAELIFKFIPSRSKIAFNMLTVAEVDPSVETKTADDRIVEL